MAEIREYLHAQRRALHERYVRGPVSAVIFEFCAFGIKQAWACLFGGLLLTLIVLTHVFYPDHAALPRYDFLTICAILIQLALLATRLESIEEAKVILVFHIVGTCLLYTSPSPRDKRQSRMPSSA